MVVNNGLLVQFGYTGGQSLSYGVYCTFPISYTRGYEVILCPASSTIAWQGNPPCLMTHTSELSRFMWAVYSGGSATISWISIGN